MAEALGNHWAQKKSAPVIMLLTSIRNALGSALGQDVHPFRTAPFMMLSPIPAKCFPVFQSFNIIRKVRVAYGVLQQTTNKYINTF